MMGAPLPPDNNALCGTTNRSGTTKNHIWKWEQKLGEFSAAKFIQVAVVAAPSVLLVPYFLFYDSTTSLTHKSFLGLNARNRFVNLSESVPTLSSGPSSPRWFQPAPSVVMNSLLLDLSLLQDPGWCGTYTTISYWRNVSQGKRCLLCCSAFN